MVDENLCLSCPNFKEINKSVYYCDALKEVIRIIRTECEHYPSKKYNQKGINKKW